MLYRGLLKSLLFQKDAEEAHDYVMRWGERTEESPFLQWLANSIYFYDNPILGQTIDGLFFPNPVGLAAGFDKNAHIVNALESIGFGFIEVGSITAKPSRGNPKPRAFRLPKDKALINRMGLNNHGAIDICHRLQQIKCNIPLGINIAKTHDPSIMGDAAIQDYKSSFTFAQKVADYITLNISCPNTTEGKTFEDAAALHALLSAVLEEDAHFSQPVYVKFSVDLEKKELQQLVELCLQYKVSGFVETNTSTSREDLKHPSKELQEIGRGGLSGAPISKKSTQTIQWINEVTKGKKTIIGVGGIMKEQDALDKIAAGAHLLQVYTGLVYQGPALIKMINRSIADQMDKYSVETIHELRQSLPN